MRVLSAQATEYVSYRITATGYDGTNISLSSDIVKFAFVAVGAQPVAGDWKTATWVGAGVAGVLVGPGTGGIVVAVGMHDVWAQVTDNPEQPSQKVGTLSII